MKIRIDTPIARLAADLPEDRVKDLLQIALEYATGGPGIVQGHVYDAQPGPVPAPRIKPNMLQGADVWQGTGQQPQDAPKPWENATEERYK